MKVLKTLSRILVGMVFMFSGFVKAVDPLGSTYKFSDYFNAFHLDFLDPLAFPLAILLSSAELLLGIALLLGYRMHFMSRAVLVFMSFFTILTFILALTNPVTDCGCFGDALILTNWETFLKNLILMVFTLIIFFREKDYPVLHRPQTEWLVLTLYFLAVITFSFYNYRHLPVIDFRPYSVGTHIPSAMEVPADAPVDEYETKLVYRDVQSNEEKEFSIDDFPRDTSRWKFVDSESVLVSKGYEPPIHDFLISNSQNEDITSLIIENKDYNLLLVSYNLEGANKEALQEARKFFHLSRVLEDLNFYAITASSSEKASLLKDSLDLGYNFAMADETMLKTTIRSNPGLILVSEGTIMAKWAYPDFPGEEFFNHYPQNMADFPFCEGCDLRKIAETPAGYAGDRYQTSLYYQNKETGEQREFTMEDFPRDENQWQFVRTENTRIRGDYTSPLDFFRLSSAEGTDYTNMILDNDRMTMLFFTKDLQRVNSDSLNKINKLAALAPEYAGEPVSVYGVTAADEETLSNFSSHNVLLFDFLRLPQKAFKRVNADDYLILLIKDGLVINKWRDRIPGQEDFQFLEAPVLPGASEMFLSSTLSWYRNNLEKRIVYLFILGFLVSVFVIRTVLYPSKKS